VAALFVLKGGDAGAECGVRNWEIRNGVLMPYPAERQRLVARFHAKSTEQLIAYAA
jgi:hypothetical protein